MNPSCSALRHTAPSLGLCVSLGLGVSLSIGLGACGEPEPNAVTAAPLDTVSDAFAFNGPVGIDISHEVDGLRDRFNTFDGSLAVELEVSPVANTKIRHIPNAGMRAGAGVPADWSANWFGRLDIGRPFEGPYTSTGENLWLSERETVARRAALTVVDGDLRIRFPNGAVAEPGGTGTLLRQRSFQVRHIDGTVVRFDTELDPEWGRVDGPECGRESQGLWPLSGPGLTIQRSLLPTQVRTQNGDGYEIAYYRGCSDESLASPVPREITSCRFDPNGLCIPVARAYFYLARTSSDDRLPANRPSEAESASMLDRIRYIRYAGAHSTDPVALQGSGPHAWAHTEFEYDDVDRISAIEVNGRRYEFEYGTRTTWRLLHQVRLPRGAEIDYEYYSTTNMGSRVPALRQRELSTGTGDVISDHFSTTRMHEGDSTFAFRGSVVASGFNGNVDRSAVYLHYPRVGNIDGGLAYGLLNPKTGMLAYERYYEGDLFDCSACMNDRPGVSDGFDDPSSHQPLRSVELGYSQFAFGRLGYRAEPSTTGTIQWIALPSYRIERRYERGSAVPMSQVTLFRRQNEHSHVLGAGGGADYDRHGLSHTRTSFVTRQAVVAHHEPGTTFSHNTSAQEACSVGFVQNGERWSEQFTGCVAPWREGQNLDEDFVELEGLEREHERRIDVEYAHEDAVHAAYLGANLTRLLQSRRVYDGAGRLIEHVESDYDYAHGAYPALTDTPGDLTRSRRGRLTRERSYDITNRSIFTEVNYAYHTAYPEPSDAGCCLTYRGLPSTTTHCEAPRSIRSAPSRCGRNEEIFTTLQECQGVGRFRCREIRTNFGTYACGGAATADPISCPPSYETVNAARCADIAACGRPTVPEPTRVHEAPGAVAEVAVLVESGRQEYRRTRYSYAPNPESVGLPEMPTTMATLDRAGEVGGTQRYGYDALGNVVWSADQNGHVTRTDTDARGRPVATYMPNGGRAPSVSYHYQDDTFPASIRIVTRSGPHSHEVVSFYDGLGRVIQTQQPSPAGGTMTQDTEYLRTTAQVRRRSLPFHQASGRLGVYRSTQSLRRNETRFDVLDRPIGRVEYDGDGNETRRTTVRYGDLDEPDAEGALSLLQIERTDAQGDVSITEYDPMGRAVRQELPDGSTIGMRYESRGLLEGVRLTSDGATIPVATNEYDGLGRNSQRWRPETGEETQQYNLVGEVIRTEDAEGRVIRFEHDFAGRVVLAAGSDESYTYRYDTYAEDSSIAREARVGSVGLLTEMRHLDASGNTLMRTDRAYDGAGFAREQVVRLAGLEPKRATLTFDPWGRLYEIRYQEGQSDAHSIHHHFGRQFRLEGISEPLRSPRRVAEFSYDALGRLSETRLLPRSATEALGRMQFRYDAQSRRIGMNRPGALSSDQAFGYELAFDQTLGLPGFSARLDERPAALETQTRGTSAQGYALRYNGRGFLTNALAYRRQSGRWQGDLAANVSLQYTTGGSIRRIQRGLVSSSLEHRELRPHSIRIGSQATQTIDHDATGNIVEDGFGNAIEYSAFGPAHAIQPPDGAPRIELYRRPDSRPHTIIERGSSSQTVHHTVYIAGVPVAEYRDGEAHRFGVGGVASRIPADSDAGPEGLVFLWSDHLGSTRVAQHESGEILGHYEYDPLGLATATSDYEPRLGFAGMENLPRAAAPYYLAGARLYDPRVGRFTSVDPLVDHPAQRDLNGYHYAANAPTYAIDQEGQLPQIVAGILIGAGIGAVVEITTQLITEGRVHNWRSVGVAAGAGAVAALTGAIGPTLVRLGANIVLDGLSSYLNQTWSEGHNPFDRTNDVDWGKIGADIVGARAGGLRGGSARLSVIPSRYTRHSRGRLATMRETLSTGSGMSEAFDRAVRANLRRERGMFRRWSAAETAEHLTKEVAGGLLGSATTAASNYGYDRFLRSHGDSTTNSGTGQPELGDVDGGVDDRWGLIITPNTTYSYRTDQFEPVIRDGMLQSFRRLD